MEIEQIENDLKYTKRMFNKMMDMNDYNWVHKIVIEIYLNQLEKLQYQKGLKTNVRNTAYS